MKQTIAHDLPVDLARQAATAALAYYAGRFPQANIRADWRGPHEAQVSMTIKGFTLKPRIAIRLGAIDVDVEIPLLARPFEGRARARIERELAMWVDKARRGELPPAA